MKFKVGLCQMMGSLAEDININKKETWEKAESMIREAAASGCDMVSLPEMWNTPYANKYFRPFAETEDGPTVKKMGELAKELGIYLIGGTISEIEGDNVYNTSYIYDRKGNIIGKHRKAHLFDIDVKGGIRFMESETLTQGDSSTVVDTEFGKIGVAICFDVRFPDLFMKMVLDGAMMVFLPGAFNMTTGPVHWELAMRSRAVDNQIYFAAISPARCMEGPYQAYGHSMVVTPWADIVAEAGSGEEIVYAEIDTDYVESIRKQLPLLSARRPELY